MSQEVLAEREAFLMKQPELSERQLVFLDESAIGTISIMPTVARPQGSV